MKNKIAISIILTLLMIVSTFSVATGNSTNDCPELTPEPGEIEVVKQVWNGTAWTDEHTVSVGDNVSYKITITFHKTCGFKAININVTDSLDPTGDVAYVIDADSFNVEPTQIGQPIIWNLTNELYDNESLDLLFNVTITEGCGELINAVSVDALERCCGKPLYGEDSVTVTVECDEPCEPGIDVNKTVYDPETEEWVDFLDDVTIGDLVKFKIEITYIDCESGYELLNMIIRDMLPCCLEFNKTVNIFTTGEMDQPSEDVSSDGKVVYWNWTFDRHIVLHDGDMLTVVFLAKFVNYCETIGENWAYVETWGCSGPTYSGRDEASVDCNPPDTTFEKKVYDGNLLVDEINATVGETLRFRLELNYYGIESLYDIQFYDELPCVLIYADNLASNIENISDYVNVSENLKEIWWNLTGVILEDGETIWIEFDAEVTGATECGCDCEMDAENFAYVVGRIGCAPEINFYMEDTVLIHSYGNCPPSIPQIRGDTTGYEGDMLSFTVFTTDSDDDQVSYTIDWDGETQDSGLFPEGTEQTFTHSWETAGTYQISVMATDEHGSESDWSYPLTVTIKEEEQPPEEGLKINAPGMFNIKTVSACIENTGSNVINDITWNFSIYGGSLLKWLVNTNGTIETLDTESSECVLGGPVTLKFGKATIEINAEAGELEDSLTTSAFVLGRIILIL